MKKLILLCIYFLAQIASAADINIKQGEYTFGNCKAYVRFIDYNNYYDISITQGTNEGNFKMSRDGRLVKGMGICNGDSGDRSDTLYTVKNASQFSVFTAKCGGKMDATDFVGQLIVNKSSGQIDHAFFDKKIAKYSTGPGVHSGPLKDQADKLNCSTSGAISENQNLTTRVQVEDHLKKSKDAQKMPSLAEIKPQAAPEKNDEAKVKATP